MDFEYFSELISSLTEPKKLQLADVIKTVDEIEQNTVKFADSFTHLVLREKYFILIQSIIEVEHELFIKFSFNILQNFITCESDCLHCSSKEKAQFILNILRFIEHTHISKDLTKLEIFKFLMNNHESIELLLNTKILISLIQISLNQYESSNQFVQSSAKALIIKYTAVFCNQINSCRKKLISEPADINFDTYLVSYFQFLLDIFDDCESRSLDLRLLMLECLELILNNLYCDTDQTNYKLIDNEAFVDFAWQKFCPSILCQFTDSIMSPMKINKMPFKQIYTILLQLTGLIGSCVSMISVFEAIYQRILFSPPEQDRNLLLKLFKSVTFASFYS